MRTPPPVPSLGTAGKLHFAESTRAACRYATHDHRQQVTELCEISGKGWWRGPLIPCEAPTSAIGLECSNRHVNCRLPIVLSVSQEVLW